IDGCSSGGALLEIWKILAGKLTQFFNLRTCFLGRASNYDLKQKCVRQQKFPVSKLPLPKTQP
ncbi:hypothetical protein ACE4PR_004697, partial [Escherichia coli]